MFGQEVAYVENYQTNATISVAHLPNGIYNVVLIKPTCEKQSVQISVLN